MIKESFIFLDRVSQITETKIWRQGIKNWNEFLDKKKINGFSPSRKIFYDQKLLEASKALLKENSSFFKNMPETWRLYNQFKEDAVFLDIETTSLYGNITVVGMYDSYDTKTMVKGFNLDKELLKKELAKYKLIITFNGASFDLPIIEKYFQGVIPKVPHIDLRHICARIGLRGGLKMIEGKLGIKRPKIIEDIYGGDAALLWRKYLATGNKRFINLLVEYNEEDIVNLKPVAEYTIKKLWQQTRFETTPE